MSYFFWSIGNHTCESVEGKPLQGFSDSEKSEHSKYFQKRNLVASNDSNEGWDDGDIVDKRSEWDKGFDLTGRCNPSNDEISYEDTEKNVLDNLQIKRSFVVIRVPNKDNTKVQATKPLEDFLMKENVQIVKQTY